MVGNYARLTKGGILTLPVDSSGPRMLAEHGPAMYRGCWIKTHKDFGDLGFLSVDAIRV